MVMLGLFAAIGATAFGMHTLTLVRQQDLDMMSSDSHSKMLELELQKHRGALDQLASGLDVLVLLTDRNTKILYANERACAAFGSRDLVGQKLMAATLSSPLEQLVKDAAETGERQQSEIHFEHPREMVGLVSAWGEPPDFDRFFVSIYDVTDLRRLERVRSDFVANVSHELRTPMATIRMMSETLLDEEEAEKREMFLGKIIKEVDRLTNITSDLLTLSKAESEPTASLPCSLSEIVHDAAILLTSKAEGKGLEYKLDIDKDVYVYGSEDQISQVVINLIDNAINYTQEGSVCVKVREKDGFATLKVSDSGIGIPGDQLPRIFERFYRVDKGRSRDKGGTGLGLSIVRNIVEAHGGRVSVQSVLHQGSTFCVELPIADAGT